MRITITHKDDIDPIEVLDIARTALNAAREFGFKGLYVKGKTWADMKPTPKGISIKIGKEI